MVIKLLKDVWNLPGEVREVKKIFKNFDQDENPKEVREEIVACGKRNSIIDNFLKVNKTENMILRAEENAKKGGWVYACQEAVKEMGVNYEIRGAKNIPENGRVLYVSNHPYGLLDATILVEGLGSLISEKGRKLKVIGMNQLKAIKGIEDIVCFVHSTAKKINFGALKEPLRYLSDGGDLAIFPSGRMSKAGLEEYDWKNLRIFLTYSSNVVPMWFSSPDHAKMYNFLAKFKKTEQERRILSLRETWNKKEKKVILNIGKPISSEELIKPKEPKEKRDNGEIVQYIRKKAEALKVAV